MPFNNPNLKIAGAGLWELAEDLVFTLELGGGESDTILIVPKGFVTDLASTPWIIWWFIPPFGLWSKPAILHDYLYRYDGQCSRFLADAWFHESMAECGVHWFKRFLIYHAVRLFGWYAWKHPRKKLNGCSC